MIRLTRELTAQPDLTGRFDKETLNNLGQRVVVGYDQDLISRSKWEKRSEAAFSLALQQQEAKSFPWVDASNVKFPLVTIAAVHWHSRAYPLLLHGPDIVKARVVVPDPEGKIREAATRVGQYMSYQLLEDSPSWEPEMDRALLQVPIVGCAFKKVYYSPGEGRNVSELVSARDFVINYWAKSIPTAQRKTHRIYLHRNDIYSRVRSGLFRNCLEDAWYTGASRPKEIPGQARRDARTGTAAPQTPDETTPFLFLEQHVRMDLDGDGYAEPYIITVEAASGTVCRILTNFDWESIHWTGASGKSNILRIREDNYFVKIPFIPQPDGGFYDMGFGTLLGPLNASVDSLINQLIDAGTVANTSGGFLGRGVKIRGGEVTFRPFGWQRVDSTGEDLSKGIFPFPVREPSQVLLSLLSILIDYTNRISGSTDIMVGENPGQNTPAETTRSMVEQGSKINSAIFKRVWQAMREEFQLLFLLNKRHTPSTVLQFGEGSGWITKEDFNLPEEAIRPAADPNLASDTTRAQQAMTVKQAAATTPGYDKDEVELLFLRAFRVENIEKIFPGSKKIPPVPHPKVMIEQMKLQGKAATDASRLKEKAIQIMADREKTTAEIELIKAEIAAIISEIGEVRAAQQVKAFEAHIGALQAMEASQQSYLKILQQGTSNGNGPGSPQGMAKQPGNPGGPSGPGAPNQPVGSGMV